MSKKKPQPNRVNRGPQPRRDAWSIKGEEAPKPESPTPSPPQKPGKKGE